MRVHGNDCDITHSKTQLEIQHISIVMQELSKITTQANKILTGKLQWFLGVFFSLA